MTDKIPGEVLPVRRPSLSPKHQRKSSLVKKSLKMFAVRYSDGAATQTEQEEEQRRIFLYLRPTAVNYDDYDNTDSATASDQNEKSIEIHLAHADSIITRLGDGIDENTPMFKIEEFLTERPTFILMVKQDNIEDIMKFSDSPLILTLHQVQKYDNRYSGNDMDKRDVQQEKSLILAQGHMDLLQLFMKKRTNATLDIFLYPTNPAFNSTTCKMKWDIYTLIPLLKDIKFSNAIFICFTSIFNAPNDLIVNDCHDITARLSFKPKQQLNGNVNLYHKIFICQYAEFTKGLIDQQLQSYKWENLKPRNFSSYSNLGINSSIRFSLNKIFGHILCTEYVNFDFKSIDFHTDYALICNSLHRFILTDEMHLKLEQFLINNQQEILVEVFNQTEPRKILLEGSIDLSIFLFPEVKSVSFAVALKAPQQQQQQLQVQFKKDQPEKFNKNKDTSKLVYPNVLPKNSNVPASSETPLSTSSTTVKTSQPKTTFAIIRVCLKEPITNPAVDLSKVFNLDNMDREIYSTCWSSKQSLKPLTQTETQKYEAAYQSFDDCTVQLKNYIIKNHIRVIEQTISIKNFFCAQTQILMDRILALIACDFNKRFPTKTNPEFTNLMTTVYKELVERVYNIILENNSDVLYPISSVTYTQTQLGIMDHMSIMKYLYEIRQDDLATYFTKKLEEQYSANKMYRFYKFLYAVEKKHFELAQEYIDRPLRERDKDGEHFTDLIQIYINYMADKKNHTEHRDEDEEKNNTNSSSTLENLIDALIKLCTFKLPKFQTGWMLLYCIYKKCQYLPGINFTRYQFENLTESSFINLMYIPKSLWDIYNDYAPQYLETERAKYFWKGIKLLLRLGLYQFAEWLYDEISSECLEVEDYILKKSFRIHLGDNKKNDSNVAIKKFSLNKLPNHEQLEAFMYLIHGNTLWDKEPYSFKSAEQYGKIMKIHRLDDPLPYQLGLLRYAYYMMQQEKYHDAIKGFDFANTKYTIISSLGKAVAYYRLNCFQESIGCFAKATNFDMYMPNVWAYLALNNLKLGENYKALECWKYAKLKRENVIQLEILQELEKINHDDIFLYIDLPLTTSTINLGS